MLDMCTWRMSVLEVCFQRMEHTGRAHVGGVYSENGEGTLEMVHSKGVHIKDVYSENVEVRGSPSLDIYI